MFNRYLSGLTLLSLFFGMSLTSEAVSVGVTQGGKEIKQKARIKQGIKSGELNKKEAKRLAKQQKKINKYKQKAERDGYLSKYEKQKLRKKRAIASKSIYKEKHDKQKRLKHKGRTNEVEVNEAAAAKEREEKEIQEAQALSIEPEFR